MKNDENYVYKLIQTLVMKNPHQNHLSLGLKVKMVKNYEMRNLQGPGEHYLTVAMRTS